MSITGKTKTYKLLSNEQFTLSSSTKNDLSSVKITDENGLNVSECFDIKTRLVKVKNNNIILDSDCDTSLEIKITKGVKKTVDCDYINYREIQETGLIIFEFSDKEDSDNIHPECCEFLGFTPEIGTKGYYVCRWASELDPTDCNNYALSGQFDNNGYAIFNYEGGGTVNSVPSVECCYSENLIEQNIGDLIHCIEDIKEVNECVKFTPIDIPTEGYVIFLNSESGQEIDLVPTTDCCVINGFNSEVLNGLIRCYNSLIVEKPTITITSIDSCCKEGSINTPIRDF